MTTIENEQTFEVGQAVNREHFPSLPIGTVVDVPLPDASHRPFTKGQDGLWTNRAGRTESDVTMRHLTGVTIVSLPEREAAPALPGVGERVTTYDQFREFPVGTVLRREHEEEGSDERYFTRVPTGYRRQSGAVRRVNAFSPTAYTYIVESLPDQVEAPGSTVEHPAVGTTDMTAEQIDALPVGSWISQPQLEDQWANNHFEKGQDGRWRHSTSPDSPSAHRSSHGADSFPGPSWCLARLGTAPRFTVGQELHEREEFAALPIGTVHEYRFSGAHVVRYTKVGDNEWRTSEGATRGNGFAPRGNRIVSLPGSTVEPAAPAAAPQFMVGQVATMGVIEALPAGARVVLASEFGRGSARGWVKQEDGSLHLEENPAQTAWPIHFGGGWVIASLPDGSTVEPPAPAARQFTIGERSEGTDEWLDALPIGTRMNQGPGDRMVLVKRGQDDFHFEGNEHRYQNHGVGTSWVIVTLPDAEPRPFQVGDRVRVSDPAYCRDAGGQDGYVSSSFYGQEVTVRHLDDIDGNLTVRLDSGMENVIAPEYLTLVTEVPASSPVAPPAPGEDTTPIPGQETFLQYVERCRTMIRGRAQGTDKRSQVHKIDDAFTALGLTRPEIGPGTVLYQYEIRDEDLPDGTVVKRHGSDGTDVSDFGIYRDGGWVTVTGRHWSLAHPYLMEVTSYPGRVRPRWVDEVGSAVDVRRIEEFKVHAAGVGRDLKRQGWCEVVDETFEELGIDLHAVAEDAEPATETVTVTVRVNGVSSGYWDDLFSERLGVSVDNPTIEVHWSTEVEVEVEDVPEGECACERVTESMCEPYVEHIEEFSDIRSIDPQGCNNC